MKPRVSRVNDVRGETIGYAFSMHAVSRIHSHFALHRDVVVSQTDFSVDVRDHVSRQ